MFNPRTWSDRTLTVVLTLSAVCLFIGCVSLTRFSFELGRDKGIFQAKPYQNFYVCIVTNIKNNSVPVPLCEQNMYLELNGQAPMAMDGSASSATSSAASSVK